MIFYLNLVSPEERRFDTSWNGMDLKGKLRYFTGTEIARLMGFPVDCNENFKSTDNNEEETEASPLAFHVNLHQRLVFQTSSVSRHR